MGVQIGFGNTVDPATQLSSGRASIASQRAQHGDAYGVAEYLHRLIHAWREVGLRSAWHVRIVVSAADL